MHMYRGLSDQQHNRHHQMHFHRHRPSVPYAHNPIINRAQPMKASHRLQEERRGSTPSPTRIDGGIGSFDPIAGDHYENFHTNSLGRGKNRNNHGNRNSSLKALVMHGSCSPLLGYETQYGYILSETCFCFKYGKKYNQFSFIGSKKHCFSVFIFFLSYYNYFVCSFSCSALNSSRSSS